MTPVARQTPDMMIIIRTTATAISSFLSILSLFFLPYIDSPKRIYYYYTINIIFWEQQSPAFRQDFAHIMFNFLLIVSAQHFQLGLWRNCFGIAVFYKCHQNNCNNDTDRSVYKEIFSLNLHEQPRNKGCYCLR